MTTDPRQAENVRTTKLRNRDHRRHIANLKAAGVDPAAIDRAWRTFLMQEETRALRGGSGRVRRMYGPPFGLREPVQAALVEEVGPFFDEPFPSIEQLPRTMEAVFVSMPGPAGPVTQLFVNGRAAGRPLGDHGREAGHRWQYAFNIAFATCLGWSPVLRGLLGVERLSDPWTANVEDGQYARSVEEQAAWMVFVDARAHGWYERSGPRARLLRQVRALVATLEVAARPDEDWRQAIVTGVTCMRRLWAADGGTLHADAALGVVELYDRADAALVSA
jgi:hypothetical protein